MEQQLFVPDNKDKSIIKGVATYALIVYPFKSQLNAYKFALEDYINDLSIFYIGQQ